MSGISAPWKILVVDDDPEVHAVTKLVMGREVVLGRPLEFQWAASGIEAKRILGEEDDFALALVDVVMESDDAGLELTRWIREDLQNRILRVVLRTGHPGEAPEMEVITGYDINDYNEKSELTAKKLRTIFYTALRGYRDLRGLEASCRGLRDFNDLLVDLLRYEKLEEFASRLLSGLTGMIEEISGMVLVADSDSAAGTSVVAACGSYEARGADALQDSGNNTESALHVEDLSVTGVGLVTLRMDIAEDASEAAMERFTAIAPVVEKTLRAFAERSR